MGKKVNEGYIIFLERFLTWAESEELPLGADKGIDIALVRYFNRQHLLGHLPHVDEKTLAAIMHREARFSKRGHGVLPRSFRALAGWRKKCPATSRSPMPWLASI